MRIVNSDNYQPRTDVEHIDTGPHYRPGTDWRGFMQTWCDNCVYSDGRCDAIWELGINGWSRVIIQTETDTICTDFGPIQGT